MAFANKYKLLLGAATSGNTSSAHFIGDYDIIALSYQSQTNSASTLTIQASGAEGFTAAIPSNSWSNLTMVTTQGPQTLDPGLRWLRVIRSESSSTVELSAQINR